MTKLHVRAGRLSSLDEFQQWFQTLSPVFSVLEPALVMRAGGQRGPSRDFEGLVAGRIDLGESRIAELRLDWQDGCLHFVAEGDGFLWSSHSISEAFVPTAGKGQTVPLNSDLVATTETAFWRIAPDLARFTSEGRNLTGERPALLTQFHRGPHLVAWWFQRPEGKTT